MTTRYALLGTGILCALLVGSARGGVIFSEDFTGPFPGSWVGTNRSSPMGGYPSGWSKGAQVTVLASRTGDQNFVSTNFETAGDAGAGNQATASTWLISPILNLHNGDVLSFETSCYQDQTYPDRMQVRLNATNTGTDVGTTATSIGDFTQLLLDINPNYSSTTAGGAYPLDWTTFQVTLSSLPASGVDGRFAFHYYVEDAGDSGTRGSEIGVDTVRLTSSVPEPVALMPLATFLLLAGRRKRHN